MNLPKVYDPKQYEPGIYALWETSGALKPSGKEEPYSITLPPPNANGNLHVGHALMIPIEDILVRYHRMKGFDTVFIPGADHAGFETWVVYEKHLQKEGKSRFDFSREELYAQVWDFVEKQRGNMELQLRELGASLSWDHLVFTLDKKVINTVYGTFNKMWEDGLVYRGERIVNFCTTHQTSFADIEVVHKNEKTKLWKIAYPLLERVGEIVVATTRPETMLGDTAVAVNPNDERYKDLIGMHVSLPILNKEIPIVADDAIDPDFGTGAVKVTPAHDPTDFEIGERHNLQKIQVIDFNGRISHEVMAGYSNLTPEEARQRVLFELNELELLRGEENYEHAVAHCYKCDSVIQPLIKDQWFVRVAPLAERAIKALENDEIKFTPKSKKRVLIQYLKGLKDWNISRQIPWGIPIPAFQNVDDHDDWIFDDRVENATIEVDGKTYRREEDTFDTWFSSGQWPFITTDYLDGGELSKFYPLSVMETGHDIMYAWVSRMIMLGLYRTDQVPFRDVYLHGLVLDEKGQKMSKSKGNVINPQEVISEFGSDALRMGIVSARSAGLDQAFSPAKVVAGRNFCNKLWNIARYIEGKVGESSERKAPDPTSLADHWVARQLNHAAKEIGTLLENYRFAEAAEMVYHVIWDDVADWYIEASKQDTNTDMLKWVLETCLKIAHPFAPFVTETIWQTLKWEETPLIVSSWPKQLKCHSMAAAEFEQVQKLVAETRYVAADLGSGKQTMLYEQDSLIHDNADLIRRLAKLSDVRHTVQPKGLQLAVANREAWLEVDEETLYEHQSKLEVRLSECRQTLQRLEARLSNESYVKNAPQRIVEETRQQLKDQQQLSERLARELDVLS
jgi:valyl-tRNA synthetase